MLTWNCWRVIVDGSQNGPTSTTRCWRRSAVMTADDWPVSPVNDVGGFSLKKSVRIRSTWAFHSRRRSSILSCISSQAARCRSLRSCDLLSFIVATLALSSVGTTAGDCDASRVRTKISTIYMDDIYHDIFKISRYFHAKISWYISTKISGCCFVLFIYIYTLF